MTCETCTPFCVEVSIRGPSELTSLVDRIRNALEAGALKCVPSTDEGRGLIQDSFLDLEFRGSWPDVLDYRFRCRDCGGRFELTAETYHGRGGRWRPVG